MATSASTSRQPGRHPGPDRRPRRSTSRSWSTRCPARHPAADPAPLLATSCAARIELNEAFNGAIDEYGYKGQYRGRLPDQGQPEPQRRRGDHRVRPAVPLRPRGRLQARAARDHGACTDDEGADHLQRLQGRGVHRDRAARLEDGQEGHPRRREATRARPLIHGSPSSSASRRRSACGRGCRRAAPGRWEQSGGDRSKFGLSAARDGRRRSTKLQGAGQARQPQAAPLPPRQPDQRTSGVDQERAARGRPASTSRLLQAGRAAASYLDVGGGLGVDYDGSQTNFASSMNYTVQEYANDVVYADQGDLRRGRRAPPEHRVASRAARWRRTTRCWSSTCSA